MEMNKRWGKKVAVLGLSTSLVLAACGGTGGSSSGASSVASGSETTEVSFEGQKLQLLFSGSPQPHEKEFFINEYIPAFEDEYGVTVNVDFVAQADAITKIQTEQDSGNIVTDVVYVDTANMAPYIEGEWTRDITALVEESGNTYTEMFDETTNKDGKRYFVPNSFDVYLVAANRQALDYLPDGVTEEDVTTGLTWEQYAEWAVSIAEGEGVGKTMYPTNMTGSQLLYPLGGMGLAYGAEFPEFNTEGFKAAMQPLVTMAEGNAFYPEQNQYTAPTDPMKAGDVWLTFAHMGPIGAAYTAAPNDYIIGPAPLGTVGAGTTAGSWTFGIQTDAPNEALAEEFLKFTMVPENNYMMNVGMGGMLSPIAEVGELLESGDVIMMAGSNMLDTATISGVPSTQFSDWNAVKLLYGNLFDEINSTKQLPDDSFFDNLQTQLDSYRN